MKNLKVPLIGLLACGLSALMLSGCGQGVATEAFKAERDGRIINNEMMTATYPSTFRPADPPYLERDFEAGADFICDEIKLKRHRDICAEADINWRR
jgi:hypothetical protein